MNTLKKLSVVKVTLAASVAICLTAPKSNAVSFTGEYTFGDTQQTQTAEASGSPPGVSFSQFFGVGVNPVQSGNPPVSSNFVSGNPGRAYIANNWSGNTPTDYFTFTITPTGSQVTLTSLEVDTQRSTTGPTTLDIRSSIDGYATSLSGIDSNPTSFATNTTPLNSDFSNLTSAVEFRIYGYNASGDAGTLRVDNVQTFGDVQSAQAVPFEISPGLGSLLLGAWGSIAYLQSLKKRNFSKSAFSNNISQQGKS